MLGRVVVVVVDVVVDGDVLPRGDGASSVGVVSGVLFDPLSRSINVKKPVMSAATITANAVMSPTTYSFLDGPLLIDATSLVHPNKELQESDA